jgi:hypothetical protein
MFRIGWLLVLALGLAGCVAHAKQDEQPAAAIDQLCDCNGTGGLDLNDGACLVPYPTTLNLCGEWLLRWSNGEAN